MRLFIPFSAMIIFLIAVDQWSKYLVETRLVYHLPVHVFGPLSWFRTWNEGIAFSMLDFIDNRWLIGLTLVLSVVIVFLWRNMRRDRSRDNIFLLDAGFIFIVGGALGNLIDRVRLGHVIDFILLRAGDWSFAVFNLADSFITMGAGLIILDEIRRMRLDTKRT